MNGEALISALELKPHVEGGFYKRTYTSSRSIDDGDRATMTSIFYLLTTESPICHLHRNSTCDIVHYYHLGLPVRFTFISPEGICTTTTLGPDIAAGHKLQMTSPAGVWKTGELLCDGGGSQDYGLTSEAVSPGFDFADHQFATMGNIKDLVPNEWKKYKHFIRKDTHTHTHTMMNNDK